MTTALQGRDLLLRVERALMQGGQHSQLSEILGYILRKVGEMIEMVWGAAWVFSEEEDAWLITASHGLTPEAAAIRFPPQSALPCRVGERGVPLLVGDLESCEFYRSTEEHYRMRSALYAPMKVGARTVGVLAIYSDRQHCYTDHDLQLVSALGEDLGATVAFAIIEDRATQIAVLEERDRQARDLHDGVQQVFSSLRIYVREAERALGEDNRGKATQALHECSGCIEEASAEIAASIAALREHIDMFADVYEVLRRMRRRMAAAGVEVTLEIQDVPLAAQVSDVLSWICREATTNVLKHSDATHVELRLHRVGEEAVLSIADNGVGLGAGSVDAGRLRLGLQVMRERAERVDGVLELGSEPGAGVRVSCRVPITPRVATVHPDDFAIARR